jgi:chemotaxis protein CheC
MPNDALTEDQRDALQEIANIGMGSAGAKLASLLGRFVELSIPRISAVDCEQLKERLQEMLGSDQTVSAFRQSFRCDIVGEAMVFFDDEGANELWDAIYGNGADSAQKDPGAHDELLFEVANLLTGACLTGLFEQIGRAPIFSVPRAIGAHLSPHEIIESEGITLNRALLLDINVRVEQSRFTAHLLALMAEDSIERLRNALDEFLASL